MDAQQQKSIVLIVPVAEDMMADNHPEILYTPKMSFFRILRSSED